MPGQPIGAPAASRQPRSSASTCPPTSTTPTTPRRLATPGHYAYVKIAEGCDYKCAFCVIPEDARALPQPQHRVGGGRSARARRPRRQGTAARVAGHDVLRHRPPGTRRPAAAHRGARRRWTASSGCACSTSTRRPSPTPRSTPSPPAARSCATSTCRCSTPPIAVLKRMKRPGTRASYERLLANIRARMPDVALRTTFIVGFPGETEADVDGTAGLHHGRRLRPRRRLHLQPRGRHLGLRPGRRRAGARRRPAGSAG